VAGWWDQEDFYGPLKIYEELEKRDAQGRNFFVAGPWNHGGWTRDGSKLGKIAFGDDTGRYFGRRSRPFFAWFLKDKGPFVAAEAWTFQTGSNV